MRAYLNSHFPPAARKAAHEAIPAVMLLLAGLGIVSHTTEIAVGGILIAILDLIVAAIVARGVRQAIYALTAAVTAGLTAWGIITGSQAALIVAAATPLVNLVAAFNTDPSTTTGLPADES